MARKSFGRRIRDILGKLIPSRNPGPPAAPAEPAPIIAAEPQPRKPPPERTTQEIREIWERIPRDLWPPEIQQLFPTREELAAEAAKREADTPRPPPRSRTHHTPAGPFKQGIPPSVLAAIAADKQLQVYYEKWLSGSAFYRQLYFGRLARVYGIQEIPIGIKGHGIRTPVTNQYFDWIAFREIYKAGEASEPIDPVQAEIDAINAPDEEDEE